MKIQFFRNQFCSTMIMIDNGDSEADRVWNSQQWKQCRKLVMKDQSDDDEDSDSDGEAEEDEFDDLEETLQLMPGVNQK